MGVFRHGIYPFGGITQTGILQRMELTGMAAGMDASPEPGGSGGDGQDRFWFFNEGSDRFAHRVLGAFPDSEGCEFAVWAPNARAVEIVGDFNGWGTNSGSTSNSLVPIGNSGVWSAHLRYAALGDRYKYRVTRVDGSVVDKADPFAVRSELPPATASIIDDPQHDWRDGDWMSTRAERSGRDQPVSIYEVHLGSWGRTIAAEGRFPNYREFGPALVAHVLAHGFTHVELMPLMEHPFYGSWGYQCTGYFAPTARYGSPEDLMGMIDILHQAGVGVILDWVPSHFPSDEFALDHFDGTALYEYGDPREGHHPDWDSSIFNYGRNEVRSFLVSSAMSWLERYHADGLRVDAVASMLYRDYSRAAGEWIPNEFGGRENLEAISLLKQLNDSIAAEFPGVRTFAEESTSFPGVTASTESGGLGFAFKWDMGWMHDTLTYFRRDPIYRSWHHDDLTFRSVYAYNEHFTLPLSHDEVVHAKGSLLDQMPGDRWQKLANLRTLYGVQWTQPGKKLTFMGNELAVEGDWAHEGVLDWNLHDADSHIGVRRWVGELNRLYKDVPALHLGDCDSRGFEWIENHDRDNSVFSYLRLVPDGASTDSRPVLVVVNATPTPHQGYRVGVPVEGSWELIADSDELTYGGSGWRDSIGAAEISSATSSGSHGRPFSLEVDVSPLAVVMLRPHLPAV